MLTDRDEMNVWIKDLEFRIRGILGKSYQINDNIDKMTNIQVKEMRKTDQERYQFITTI